MRNIRVYVDTSVFGGVYDLEFSKTSKKFFEQVKNNRFELYTSAVVKDEISYSPQKVQNYFNELLPFSKIIEVDHESLILRDAYLKAKIVSRKYSNALNLFAIPLV